MMQHDKYPSWQHGHGFGQDQKRPGEVRTIIVIAITGAMMVVEIATGIVTGRESLIQLLALPIVLAIGATAIGLIFVLLQ